MHKILNFSSRAFFLLALLFIITIILYQLGPRFNHDNQIIKYLKQEKCSPFIESKQYFYTFDGVTYPKQVPLFLNKSIDFSCLNKASEYKYIFSWNSFWGQESFGYDLESKEAFEKNRCPVTKCIMTKDFSKLNSSGLVIVHMKDNIPPIPTYRPSFQKWVFLLYESPFYSWNFTGYYKQFNLTSTYRIDSDFPHFYEQPMVWERNQSFEENFDFTTGKTKLVAALISNCEKKSNRLEYIELLKKYIPVDVFGLCGTKCTSKTCKLDIIKDYKFYLSFENSLCKDYVTEKFHHLLRFNIVPIVLGGGTYEHYIPKSGFIDVKNFILAQQLAEYLVYLDSNKTAYAEYFEWKKHVNFIEWPVFSPICSMCIQMHIESFTGIQKKTIDDIHQYWHNNSCVYPIISEDSEIDFQFG